MGGVGIKAVVFDTFGTVMNWRDSIISDFRSFGRRVDIDADWEVFVDEWKTAYRPGMDAVRTGKWPWTRIDRMYRMKLDEMLPKYGMGQLDEKQRTYLTLVWHRLTPWPDSVAGLVRLKTRYIVSPLSNSDLDCLVNMAKHAGLPWDVILCAELFRHYKPDPEVYRGAIALLNQRPAEVMMVAAHNYDLRAARSAGMQTAFVSRPSEYGPNQKTDLTPEEDWDVIAEDFTALATALGC